MNSDGPFPSMFLAPRPTDPRPPRTSPPARRVHAPAPRAAAALRAIPRDHFCPQVIWRPTGGHAYARIDRAHEPGTWLTAARRTADPLITAWEETPGPGAMVAGSLPGDAYIHAALDAAGARPGRPARVLHIGTEYMAALLAHGLPPWSVTSTNSQTPTVQAEQTFQRLAAPVHVRAGDALGGLRAQEEPYDFVVMTHALRDLVPGTLPNMVRAGGVVVLTLGQDLAPVNVLVRLVITVRGRAEGRFLQPVSPHDAPWAPGHAPAPFPPPPADSPDRQYSVRLPSDLWPRNGFPRALWAIGLRLKRVQARLLHAPSGRRFLDLRDTTCEDSLSQARIALGPGNIAQVTETGTRKLTTDLLAAYDWWERHRKPGPEHFTLTVTPKTTRLRLAETRGWLL